MPVPELTQYRVYTYDPYFGPQWYFDREAHKRDLAKLARTTQEPEELWEILKEGSDYQDDPSFIQAFLDNPATPPRLLFTLAEARVRQGNSVGYILAHILDRARSGDEEARKVLQEEQRRYLENSDLFYSYEERWRLFLFRDDQSPLLAKVPELLQGILQDDTTHQSRAYLCAVILAEALAGDHALDPETYFLWARALQKLGGDERRKLARLLVKRGGPWLHLALLHNPLAPVSLEDLPPGTASRWPPSPFSMPSSWRPGATSRPRISFPSSRQARKPANAGKARPSPFCTPTHAWFSSSDTSRYPSTRPCIPGLFSGLPPRNSSPTW